MSEFLSLRNNNRPKTQAEVDAYVADEPDRTPYAGAGSMAGHARRASKQYRPTNSRARLTAAERKQFAADNLEPTRFTPEQEAELHAKVAESLKRHDIKEYFANAVRNRVGLHQAWVDSGLPGEFFLFENVARDGDPSGAPESQIIAAWNEFTQISAFAAYRYAGTDRNSPRYKVQRQILDLLWDFQVINFVNMTLAGSWAACFALLQNIGMIPAPVKSDAELRAAAEAQERNTPADDGNPVALHENGTPVTYVKNGQTIRYSRQMLEQLTSRGYEIVMGLQRVNPQATRRPRDFEANKHPLHADNAPASDGNPVAYHDDGVTPVVYEGKRYSLRMLSAVTSDEYLKIFKLSRNPRAMQPVKGL
jgi:hypothetical protein